jgi:hypothetical protein
MPHTSNRTASAFSNIVIGIDYKIFIREVYESWNDLESSGTQQDISLHKEEEARNQYPN